MEWRFKRGFLASFTSTLFHAFGVSPAVIQVLCGYSMFHNRCSGRHKVSIPGRTALRSILLACVAAAPAISGLKTPVLQFTGATITLADAPYWVAPDPVGNLSLGITTKVFQSQSVTPGSGYLPISVVHVEAGNDSTSTLESIFSAYQASDDVWSTEFSYRECNS
jgi:hypothetical protein